MQSGRILEKEGDLVVVIVVPWWEEGGEGEGEIEWELGRKG